MTEFNPSIGGELWTYRARPDPLSNHELGVIDGDTYDLFVDMGFNSYTRIRVRPPHIDTAERYTDLYDEQTEFVREWFRDAMDSNGEWPLVIRTGKGTGGFGRWLAEVFNRDGESLEAAILDEYGDAFRYEP